MMSLEEEGAYIRLMCYCWREGSIPADEKSLRALCKGGITTLMTVVTQCFQPDPNHPGRLIHKRLEEERQKQMVWREKSSAGGKKSAAKRWGEGGSEKVRVVTKCLPPNCNQSDKGGVTLQSSSSSSYNPPVRPPNGSGAKKSFPETIGAFERFWQAYPKALNRVDAERAFVEVQGVENLDRILGALMWQCASADWRREDGRFIPTPANYLRDHRWEDKNTNPADLARRREYDRQNEITRKLCARPLPE